MLIKVITLATLLCVVCAQSCTYDWECGNVPYTVCQEPAGCSTTLKGIAIDQYPNVYYATICPASSGGVEVSFKSVPLTGGVPTVLHSVPASSGQSSLSVLDGLFNSIYFQPYANGDPTLRLFIVRPPTYLTAKQEGSRVKLTWRKSQETSLVGYYIYRASTLEGRFKRLSSSFVSSTSFFDSSPLSGPSVYMVKAIKLEITPSGSYYNPSAASFARVTTTL